MSVPVALDALAQRIHEYGDVAYMITVRPEARPHVVSVRVRWSGERLVVGAGRRTLANVEACPDVTLLWSAGRGAPYSLIVDGTAIPRRLDGEQDDEMVLDVTPVAAVLHRTPEGDAASPSCVTVLERSAS